MLFESCTNLQQFSEGLWHGLFELRNRLWSSHAGDHVFALCVDQELTVELIDTVRWVTSKRDAGTGIVASVPVNHRLHVNSSAPLSGNVVLAAINNRTVIHP